MIRPWRLLAIVTSLVLIPLLGGCTALRAFTPSAQPSDPDWRIKYWGLAKINVEPVWNTWTGAGVRIAVIDTGSELGANAHPDLRTVAPPSGANVCTPGAIPDDSVGHGTKVNGVIAGARDGKYAVGVAWDAVLLPYKVDCPQAFQAVEAVRRALALTPAVDIVHGSWPQLPAQADLAPLIQGSNALFVFAAPTQTVTIPAYGSLDNVIVVTGSGEQDEPIPGFPKDASKIHIAAPGVKIRTSDVERAGYGTDIFSGPSAAAAFVTGCAALLKSADTGLTGRELKAALLAGATAVTSLGQVVENGRRLECNEALKKARGRAR